jgi:hypothetical protein
MKETPQTDTQSVWDHGQSVQNYMNDLLDHLQKDTPLKYEWKLPDWIYDPILLESLPNKETLDLYTLYHDCGKPFCLIYDEDGRKHFPNHAEVSCNTFNKVFDNSVSADLISRDMDFHLLRADKLQEFSEYEYATTLILSALSEVHSNATMFGGTDSVSFKIKWKHSNKRGRQVLNLIKTNKNKN